MSEPLTIYDVLVAGEVGDTSIDLRLTAREVAALQLLVTLATDSPVLEQAQEACNAYGVGERWNVALRSALVRLALSTSRVLRDWTPPDVRTEFSALLAKLDQERAALDDGKDD